MVTTVWVKRLVGGLNLWEYVLVEGMILADSGVPAGICGTSADLVRPMCGVLAVTPCIAWFGETCKSWQKMRTVAKLAKTCKNLRKMRTVLIGADGTRAAPMPVRCRQCSDIPTQ